MKIELLKVKFGERQLLDLDVMAKDMAESKRMNALMAKDLSKKNRFAGQFYINVISRLFWPKFAESGIQLPAFLQE